MLRRGPGIHREDFQRCTLIAHDDVNTAGAERSENRANLILPASNSDDRLDLPKFVKGQADDAVVEIRKDGMPLNIKISARNIPNSALCLQLVNHHWIKKPSRHNSCIMADFADADHRAISRHARIFRSSSN